MDRVSFWWADQVVAHLWRMVITCYRKNDWRVVWNYTIRVRTFELGVRTFRRAHVTFASSTNMILRFVSPYKFLSNPYYLFREICVCYTNDRRTVDRSKYSCTSNLEIRVRVYEKNFILVRYCILYYSSRVFSRAVFLSNKIANSYQVEIKDRIISP